MNRLFAYAIIINVALLAGFVLVDYATWNNVALNLDPIIKRILMPNDNFTEQITGIYSNYGIIQVGITVRYFVPLVSIRFFPQQQNSVGSSVNLPFIWFIVTIIVNLSLIWYLGIEKMNEPTKELKTEPISSQQQKTN